VRHAQVSTPANRHRNGFGIALVAVGRVLAIAACGSSSKTSSSTGHNAFLGFSKCMRSHGVPDFPDPSPGGGIQLSSGMNPFSPSFEAAQASCRRLLPGGGPGAAHPTAQAKAQTLKISECMRQHGVSGFPDPTLTPRPAQPATARSSIAAGSPSRSPTPSDTASPGYQQAAAACGFPH
jgi:hypothetical protein